MVPIAVVGGAEFEIVPRLAAGFTQQAQTLINNGLKGIKVRMPQTALDDITKLFDSAGVKAAKAFGSRFTKEIAGVGEEAVSTFKSLAEQVSDSITSVGDFIVRELVNVQNEINRTVAKAEIAANELQSRGQRRLQAIRAASGVGEPILGRDPNRPVLSDQGRAKVEAQNKVDQAQREANARRLALARAITSAEEALDKERVDALQKGLLSAEQEHLRVAQDNARALAAQEFQRLGERLTAPPDRLRRTDLSALEARAAALRSPGRQVPLLGPARVPETLDEVARSAKRAAGEVNLTGKALEDLARKNAAASNKSPILAGVATQAEKAIKVIEEANVAIQRAVERANQARINAESKAAADTKLVEERLERDRTNTVLQAERERAQIAKRNAASRARDNANANKKEVQDEAQKRREFLRLNRQEMRAASRERAAAARATVRVPVFNPPEAPRPTLRRPGTIGSAVTSSVSRQAAVEADAALKVVQRRVQQRPVPVNVQVDIRHLEEDLVRARNLLEQFKAANKGEEIEVRAKLVVDESTSKKEVAEATDRLRRVAAEAQLKLAKGIQTVQSGRAGTRGGLGGFIDRIQSGFTRFSESITGRAGGLAQLLGAGLTGSVFVVAARVIEKAIRAIGAAIAASIREFGQLEDALNAVRLIFGRASSDAEAFARSSARVSLSVTQALKVVQEFGTALLGVGLSNRDLANTSTILAQMAEDLASVSGIPVDQVAGKIAQGIQGDVRSLRALRINIRESDITNRAFADGLQLTGFELTEAAKLAAFLPLFFERAAFAQNDATNTAGSLNNALANLKKTISDLGAAIGEEIGPAIADWATVAAQMFRTITEGLPTLKNFLKAITESAPALRLLAKGLEALRGKYKERAEEIREAAAAQKGDTQAARDAAEFAAKDAARVQNHNLLVTHQFDVLTRLIQAEKADAQAKLAVRQAALAVTQAEHALEDARIQMERQTFVIEQAELSLAQARIQQRLVLLRAVAAEQFESRATIALKNSKLDLIAAEREYNDLRDPLTQQERRVTAQLNLVNATFDQEKATLALAKAQLQEAQSALDIFDATNKLIALRRRGTASAAELARAEIAKRQAELQFTEANIERRQVEAASPLEQEAARIAAARARQQLDRVDLLLNEEIERARLSVASAIIAQQEAEIGLISQIHQEIAASHAVTSATHAYEDAIRARLTLQDAFMSAELALVSAKRAHYDAANDAKFAQIELDDAIATAANKVITQAEKFDDFNDHLRSMARLFGVEIPDSINHKLAPAIAGIPRMLQTAFEAIEQRPQGGGSVTVTVDDKASNRAHGGPVNPFRPYIVGERGPELFIPRISGEIIPNHKLAKGREFGAGYTKILNQTNNFYNPPADPEVIGNAIARKVLQKAL